MFKQYDFSRRLSLYGIAWAVLALTRSAWGCACGCDVFDVGTSAMLPERAGWMVYANYDFQDQNTNWNGTAPAPSSQNEDKDIQTHFTDVGLQYFPNSDFGIQLEVPYDFRSFTTVTDEGKRVTEHWSQFGDIRLEGIYTGFLSDLSAGVNLGVKLPTGNFKFDPEVVDRDTQIGTGSTDLLLGGFYRHHISLPAKLFWFAQAEMDLPVFTQDHYRPGLEVDSAVGIYYSGWHLGRAKVSPVAQIIVSERASDHGAEAADPVASGFQRVLLSPGFEVDVDPVRFYADCEVPVYQHFTGNQVAAPVMVKATISYAF